MTPLATLAATPAAAQAVAPAQAKAGETAAAKKAKRKQPHGATRTASAKPKKKAQPPEGPEEADVDLLEAMVAHVRGRNAAAAKTAPAQTAKP